MIQTAEPEHAISACFREQSDDAQIWSEVHDNDEYRVPSLNGAVVLDIGAHIGSFTQRCLESGASLVVAAEPGKSSRKVFSKIHADHLLSGRVILLPFAVLGKPGESYLHYCPFDGYHSGNTCLLHDGSGEAVTAVSMASLIDLFCPDAIKLDCEGGEYPILMNTELPYHIRTLWVEWHETVRFAWNKEVAMNGLKNWQCETIKDAAETYLLQRFTR